MPKRAFPRKLRQALRGRLARGSQGLRCHVHGHLVTIAGAARIERAGQRAFGHQTQRIRTPLRDGGRRVLLRGRRHLLQRRLQGAQHHRAHLGGQPRAQHQHAGVVHPRAQRAACQPHLLGIRLRRAVGLPPRAHQPLHLRGGGAAGDGDQARLGGRGGHAREGAHRGVGKPSAGHGGTDVVEVRERCGDAQLFAGGAEIEAGAPVEPVGAGAEALPAVVAIELAQVAQQLVGGDLDTRGQLGNLVTEAIQVGRRGGVRKRRFLGTGRHRGEALIGRRLSEGPCELLGYGRLRPSCRRRLAGKHDRVVFHDGAMVHPDFGSPVTARGGTGCGFPALRVKSTVGAGRASAARILRKKQTGSSSPRNRAPQTMSTPATTKSRIIFRFVRYPGARCRRTEGAAVRHAGRVRVGGSRAGHTPGMAGRHATTCLRVTHCHRRPSNLP